MKRQVGKHVRQKPKKRTGICSAGIALATTLVICSIAAVIVYFYKEYYTDSGSALTTDGSKQSDAVVSTPVATISPSANPKNELSQSEKGSISETEMDDLQTQIDDYIAKTDYKWCVVAENATTGAQICSTQNVELETPMISASIIKLFIMGAVYEKIESGKIPEEDVSEKLTDMITISDNASANELTALLGKGDATSGMAVVNDFAESIGCTGTTMNRLMLVENGLQNYTTAKDCALFLRLVYNKNCVSENCSEKMLALLSDQMRKNKIPAALPKGVKSANKTGELASLSECDAAIVFTPNCDYILCVMTEPVNNSAAIPAIQDVSKMVYNAMIQQSALT